MSWDRNNPWNKYVKPFTQQGSDPMKPFTATAVHGKDERAAKRSYDSQVPIKVDLPDHLYRPRDAQDLDIRKAFGVGVGTDISIFRWRCPLGAIAYFFSFGLFKTDPTAVIVFTPRINDVRIFPYVGSVGAAGGEVVLPGFGDDFIGTDFSNQNLVTAQVILNPNDVITWDDVVTAGSGRAGIRMVGYVDYTQKRSNMRSGG